MIHKYYVSLQEILTSAKTIAEDIKTQKAKNLILYGIPRGGIPAMYAVGQFLDNYAMTDKPEEATVFIDDIIDSGATKSRYTTKFPNVPFYALHEKQAHDTRWIVFPWEENPNAPQQSNTIEDNIRRLLQFIGEDTQREGLVQTPQRVINAYKEWFSGYKQNVSNLFTTFEDGAENYNQMVCLRHIPFYSHCEHHMTPFFGTVTIGYLPGQRIVGISKLARLVNVFARRLQVQERLTRQIAETIMQYLQPVGTGVIIKARHLCMESRGAQIIGAETVTSAMLGAFQNESVKQELFRLANTNGG